MKLRKRRNIWFGIGAGWLLFFALAGIAYLTPARSAILQVAGRDLAALRTERELRAHVLERLQPRGPSSVEAERAREDLVEIETRITSLQRLHSKISPFGFLGWLVDLWPWLLGFGTALPILGGLVGAQKGSLPGTAAAAAAAASARTPAPSTASAPSTSSAASSVSPIETIPAEPANPKDEAVEPAAWSWNARPVARAAPARPKGAPVESPNGTVEG